MKCGTVIKLKKLAVKNVKNIIESSMFPTAEGRHLKISIKTTDFMYLLQKMMGYNRWNLKVI